MPTIEHTTSPLSVAGRLLAERCAFTFCALILTAKFVLIWRTNVNWDEFFYLTHIYEASRNEITRVFQLGYVHLFQWLPGLGEHELDQIRAGRVLAWAGLVGVVFLIARIASRWVAPAIAWIAPLAYLSTQPILQHGASFRSDAWLAPLFLLSLALLTGRTINTRRVVLSGLCFGVSIAVSLKAVLMAPVCLAFLIYADGVRSSLQFGPFRTISLRALVFCGASVTAAAVLLGLHWLTLSSVDSGAIEGFAAGAAQKTLLDSPLFPRWDYFKQTIDSDSVTWLFALAGLIAAFFRCRVVLWFALSLTPLIFYRNAFPYYYVVMLAPAAVFVAVAVDWIRSFITRETGSPAASWLPVAMSLPLLLQAAIHLERLRFSEQENQELTIRAVHEIFPDPVPYIDHSGMVASFPKVNFFMSSWGIENYQARGVGFMEPAIAEHKPPMLIANAPVLVPTNRAFESLFDQDRELIEHSYIPYWGAIRVAGAVVDLAPQAQQQIRLPFTGRYRVETAKPVLIEGQEHIDGSIFELIDYGNNGEILVSHSASEPTSLRLVWAGARPAPPGSLPPFVSLYRSL